MTRLFAALFVVLFAWWGASSLLVGLEREARIQDQRDGCIRAAAYPEACWAMSFDVGVNR